MEHKHFNSDEELVKKLQKSNKNAFNQLFYAYSSKLYHFAYGYLKSKEETEDLVQKVFSKIWEKRKELNEDLNIKSYLFTIAFNFIKKHFRSKALLNKYFDGWEFNDKLITNTNDVDFFSLKELVDKLVDTMPDKRKTVFIKSRYEGKNAKEISEEMAISKSTVENHLNKALKFLRNRLKHENIAVFSFLSLFLNNF